MPAIENQDKPESVVITDDHIIVRHALKTILEKHERYRVVGEATNVDETVAAVEKEMPALLILDLGLPGKNGLEAIRQIKSKLLPTRVLVLTMYEDETMVKQAFEAGASGYISKTSSTQELLQAIEQVRDGEVFLPPQFEHLRPKIEEMLARPRKVTRRADVADALVPLSRREREIFFMLVEGLPNRAIAKKLFISPRTVETHRARVIRKLGVDSTAGLIRYAIRNNLVSV